LALNYAAFDIKPLNLVGNHDLAMRLSTELLQQRAASSDLRQLAGSEVIDFLKPSNSRMGLSCKKCFTGVITFEFPQHLYTTKN